MPSVFCFPFSTLHLTLLFLLYFILFLAPFCHPLSRHCSLGVPQAFYGTGFRLGGSGGALTLGEWVPGGCLGPAPMVTSLRRATRVWARTLIQCSVTPAWSSPRRTRRSWNIWTLTPSTPSPTPTRSTSRPALRDSSIMRTRWGAEVHHGSSRAPVPSPCLVSCVAG